MQHKTWLSASITISVLVAIPLVFILLSLFSPSDPAWLHIRSTILQSYIANTLLLMLLVGVFTTVIGVSTAWFTAATDFPGRKIFAWALMLPMAAPAYIVAYVYTDLLDFSGPVQTAFRHVSGLGPGEYRFPQIRSLSGAALIISLVLYPYTYLLVRVSFLQRSATLFDAARTLGATPSRAFWRIALPAARPALIGGLALVLMETLADFGVVDYFAVPTFSTGIFRTWFAMGEKAAAMKLAAIMLVFVMVLIALEKKNRNAGQTQAITRDTSINRIPLSRGKASIAFISCLLPIIFGSLIPLGMLIKFSFSQGDSTFGESFSEYTFNSLQVASIATAIAVSAALLLSYAQRIANSKAIKASIQISTLGYALPGALLAAGLLAPISQFDRWLADLFDTHFAWRSGLLLTGSIAILIYAYVVRFLTVAFNTTSSGLQRVPMIYDDVARNLGAKPTRVMKSIHLPMMYRVVFAAAILVFVDTIRELPATLLLRPFNFETLATRVYRLASDERLAEASTAALAIVIIGLIPVILLNKLSDNKR